MDTDSTFSWLKIDGEDWRSLWVSPPMDRWSWVGIWEKKLSKRGEQTHSIITQRLLFHFLYSGSCFEFFPWLPSGVDCDIRIIGRNKPFPFQAAFYCGVLAKRSKQTSKYRAKTTLPLVQWSMSSPTLRVLEDVFPAFTFSVTL